MDRFLLKNIHRASTKLMGTSKIIYVVFERLMVVMGFAAILTGCVTFGGIFVSTPLLPCDVGLQG
jgi:hypothetical protein